MIGVRRLLAWRATYAARVTHGDRAPTVVFTAAAAVTLVGTFIPWLRTGSTRRSSYDLLGVLSRLGVGQSDVVSTLVRWWPVVPLLITAAVVSAWWRWTWPAVAAATSAALYAGGVAVVMMTTSKHSGVHVGPGPWVCAIGSLDLLIAATWVAVTNTAHEGHASRRSST
jgi:hypothetical protein